MSESNSITITVERDLPAGVQFYDANACGHVSKAYVFGNMFGACLLAATDGMSDAIDEWDERFGERVGDDVTAENIDELLDSGEVRINDGGTTVYVDPYEWFREFANVEEALVWIVDGCKM